MPASNNKSILGFASDGGFWRKIAVPIVKQALIVAAEDGGTANHAERLTLAQAVLGDVERYSRWFALPVACDTAAEGHGMSITDEEIEASVASLWTDLALIESA